MPFKKIVWNDRKQMSEDIQGITQRTSIGVDALFWECVCSNSDFNTAPGDRGNGEEHYSELKKRFEARGHKVEVWNSTNYDLSSDKGFRE